MSPFNQTRPSATAQPLSITPPGLDPLASIQSLDAATRARMLQFYDQPETRPKGLPTFIDALDAHFKWMPGYTNLFTGWPGSGKSEFVRQLLLLQAVFADRKSLVFAPEDMPKESWYDALIFSLTGRDPDPDSKYKLPRAQYLRAMDFVQEYFHVIVPGKAPKTPGHLLDVCEAGRAKYGIQHFVIDPFNKADHGRLQAAGGWQPYLIAELGGMTDWSVSENTCLTLVAHPAKKPRQRGEAREVPDSDGIAGGATWDDMMHFIGAVYRPNVHKSRNDPAVAFYSHKIKSHRRMGAKPGSIGEGSENPDVLIEFDWKTARYLFNGATPLALPVVHRLYAAADDPAPATPAPPPSPAGAYRPHAGLPNGDTDNYMPRADTPPF